MGNLFGSMQNSSNPLNPTAGTGNQNNFIQSLMNNTMQQKPDGSFTFAPVAGYGGQLAANPDQTILGGQNGVFNSWKPGMAGGLNDASNQLLTGQNPTIQGIQNGTSGWATPAMGNLSTYGAAGPGGMASSNMGLGLTQGNALSFLNPYMGGQNPLSNYGNMQVAAPGMQSTARQAIFPNGLMGAGGAGNVPSGAMNPFAGTQGFGGMNAEFANNPRVPSMQSFGSQQTPNQALGSLSGGMGYLSNIAGGGGAGASINQTPAWQAMVNAQQQNITTGADQLKESMNAGGGLFSSAYGSANALYQDQARLGQNAMLTSAATGAMQQANQNQFGAAGQLSGQGFGALQGLSGQQFGAAQTQYGGNLSSAQLGAQLGSQNALNSANNSAAATQAMYGAGNTAAMYGLGQGMSGLQQAGNLDIQNLLAGGQLGGQQAGLQQNQYTSQFNNWLMQQPQNNPLIQMLYGQMNSYPGQQQQTYVPGWLGSVLGAAGQAGGMLGSAAIMASDRRLKENIRHEGKVNDINLYSFNFKGLPGRQTGVIAQDLYKRHPEAVLRGSRTQPWMVNKSAVAQLLTA